MRITGAVLDAAGIGLAAPQVHVPLRIFVWRGPTGVAALVNPELTPIGEEAESAWEGCLSIPGLYVEMIRPKEVLMSGWDLDGDEVSIEADEVLARLFQHELDHLHGVLMFDRMTPDQRKAALTEYRRLQETPDDQAGPPRRRRLRLP